MLRKFGTGILILCFFLSGVNAGLAAPDMGTSPVAVNPYEVQALNQQVLALDQQNHDEEIAVQQLIEQNDQLTRSTLARQQDEGLAQINQTMQNYRNSLRGRTNIITNNENWGPSRYGDLVDLTEEADNMTVHRNLVDASGLLAQRYQMLTALKDEMTALNDKLTRQQQSATNPNQAPMGGFKNITPQEQEKIQTLVDKLGEMDQKIARLNDILSQKERQIAQLSQNLTLAQGTISLRDETIKEQKEQIAALQANPKPASVTAGGITALTPIVVNPSSNQTVVSPAAGAALAAKDQLIKEKQEQLDLLKSELERKISQETRGQPDAVQVMELKNQILNLSADLKAKDEALRYQDRQRQAIEAELSQARNKLLNQAADLNDKKEAIRWLNQVLAVAKNKAEYYRLTAQLNRLPLAQLRQQVQTLKDEIAGHFKDYDQFESAINSLKARLQDKENLDRRLKLAQQLIDLQQQELALLGEKSGLEQAYNDAFDRRFLAFENQIKAMLANRQIRDLDWQARMQGLQTELNQKQNEVDSLKSQLENKITQEKNETALAQMIQDLSVRLQDEEEQIGRMKRGIQQGQLTSSSYQQELAAAQDRADQLRQQLEDKTVQADKLTAILSDYQHKLELKNGAFNQELRQVLLLKNHQILLEKQIVDLGLRLQQREYQVVSLKKQIYDLQGSVTAGEMDQAKDLSLSMVQQKELNEKINAYQDKIDTLQATNVRQLKEIMQLRSDLDLARQKVQGMPVSPDELEYLRTGLKKATDELKQKDAMLAEVKAHADEYEKEYKQQSAQFQSLKDQLQDAQDEIQRKNEDLKYNNLAVARLKYLLEKSNGHKTGNLQVELENANMKIKELRKDLDQVESFSRGAVAAQKLDQALDKINEQGKVINLLAQKLEACGQNVDLSKDLKE